MTALFRVREITVGDPVGLDERVPVGVAEPATVGVSLGDSEGEFEDSRVGGDDG